MKPELTTVLSPHLHLYFVQAPSLFRDRDYMLVAGMQQVVAGIIITTSPYVHRSPSRKQASSVSPNSPTVSSIIPTTTSTPKSAGPTVPSALASLN